MWWPFARKREEGKKRRWLVVLPDDPKVTIENYKTPVPWLIDPETGSEHWGYCFEPISFPPDSPWIRESEAERILERVTNPPASF